MTRDDDAVHDVQPARPRTAPRALPGVGLQARAVIVALAAVVGGGAVYSAMGKTSRAVGTGVVVIDTNLAYQHGAAAGTGMVLTSSGEILTNNHVIAGRPRSTWSSRRPSQYTARVVGYDATATSPCSSCRTRSNLTTVSLGDASKLSVGARSRRSATPAAPARSPPPPAA